MYVVISLILFVCAILHSLVQKRYKFWRDRGIISPPASFPFGNLKGVGTKVHSSIAFTEFYKNFKGKTKALGVYFFVTPMLIIFDLDLIKEVLIKDFTTFHDRGFYYNKKDDPLSANLLTLEGQEWRDRRVLLSPVFTSGKMKMMFDIVDAIGDKFVKAVDKEMKITNTLEVRQLSMKFTTDVISSVAFGIDSNCLEDPNSEFFKHGKRIFDLSAFELIQLVFATSCPEFSRKLGIRASPKEPCDFLRKVFTETIQSREKENIKRNDFVQLLMKLRETVSLTLDEMAAEGFIFFTGGYETSSTTLNFCFYELALNQDIQKKLRDEIKKGIESNEGKLTYDLVFNLKYLDMVVKETLRKYPVIPVLMRKCNKDFEISGTNQVIPEGYNTMIPIYSIHHDPEFYPEPDKFDPERFSEENSKNRNPLTFLAFGEGPRGCIGMRFGYLQVKVGLIKLLTKFEIAPCEKTTIPMKFVPNAPFLAPEGGMWLQVKPHQTI